MKACGCSAVDLSGCHVDYDNQDAQAQTLEIYREANVAITGVGVVGATSDEKHTRRVFDFAKRAGCGVVSLTFPPEEYESTPRLLDQLGGETGLRVALHNHRGTRWLGNTTMLKHVFQNTGKAISLCMDTAWCIQAGENPGDWIDRFGDRLYAIHFKDFAFARNGKFADTVVGEGGLNLPEVLEKFSKLPFDGSAVVEYEGPDAVAVTARCVTIIRERLAAMKSRFRPRAARVDHGHSA